MLTPDPASLGAQTLGERIESRLGRRIDGFARDAGATGDGRHEADRATFLLDHCGEQGVGEFDRGDQIDLDEPPDRVDGHRRERPGMAEAGVVDQHVDPSEGIHRLVCEPQAVRRRGEVRDQRPPADLAGDVGSACHVAAVHQDPSARRSETDRGGAADSGRCAGDQHDSVVQLHGTHDQRR